MTTGGWIFLTLSLASVWSLLIYCFMRVIKGAQIEQPPDSLGG